MNLETLKTANELSNTVDFCKRNLEILSHVRSDVMRLTWYISSGADKSIDLYNLSPSSRTNIVAYIAGQIKHDLEKAEKELEAL